MRVLRPHNDPLVIFILVSRKAVDKVLVDTGSSVDVLFMKTMDLLGIDRVQIRQDHMIL